MTLVKQHATCNMLHDLNFCYEWTESIQHITPTYERYMLAKHMLKMCKQTHFILHSKITYDCCLHLPDSDFLHTVPFWCNGLVRNCIENLKINRHNFWTADSIHIAIKIKKIHCEWKWWDFEWRTRWVRWNRYMCVHINWSNDNQISCETIFLFWKTFNWWQRKSVHIQSMHWHSLTEARGFWTLCCCMFFGVASRVYNLTQVLC